MQKHLSISSQVLLDDLQIFVYIIIVCSHFYSFWTIFKFSVKSQHSYQLPFGNQFTESNFLLYVMCCSTALFFNINHQPFPLKKNISLSEASKISNALREGLNEEKIWFFFTVLSVSLPKHLVSVCLFHWN